MVRGGRCEHPPGLMRPETSPADYWASLPEEFRPGLLAIVVVYEARIRALTVALQALEVRIAELEARRPAR